MALDTGCFWEVELNCMCSCEISFKVGLYRQTAEILQQRAWEIIAAAGQTPPLYRVGLVWVEVELVVPSLCLAIQPIIPHSHLTKHT